MRQSLARDDVSTLKRAAASKAVAPKYFYLLILRPSIPEH